MIHVFGTARPRSPQIHSQWTIMDGTLKYGLFGHANLFLYYFDIVHTGPVPCMRRRECDVCLKSLQTISFAAQIHESHHSSAFGSAPHESFVNFGLSPCIQILRCIGRVHNPRPYACLCRLYFRGLEQQFMARWHGFTPQQGSQGTCTVFELVQMCCRVTYMVL